MKGKQQRPQGLQRLDKILSHMGFGTRSVIKQRVREGAVTVNGVQVKDSGLQIHPGVDQITFAGEQVNYREHIYLLMNKPAGVISATEDHREKTVVDLLSSEYATFQPFPVGRLDKDTEGLLILTNDGILAHQLLSPRKKVPKVYLAKVLGEMTAADAEHFQHGVTLDDGYVTLPAHLSIDQVCVDPALGVISWVKLTIMEGKFHQVKRMVEAVGKKVVYLKRLSMGALQLDDQLALGEVRELTPEELHQIRKEVK
jgi:16S rRNA pseudouridine516 synthase